MVLGRPDGSSAETRESLAARARGGLLFMGGFVALLYAIEFVNTLMLHGLNRTFGLRPVHGAVADVLERHRGSGGSGGNVGGEADAHNQGANDDVSLGLPAQAALLRSDTSVDPCADAIALALSDSQSHLDCR